MATSSLSIPPKRSPNFTMAEDLSARIDNFALYLPAVQFGSACRLAQRDVEIRRLEPFPDLCWSDLDWHNPKNVHWHYKWCLASAGHFARASRDNIISNRHQDTIVVGDSGGFQIATGAMKETRGWADLPGDEVIRRWQESDICHRLVDWLDAHCNWAMTIDMPLWIRSEERRGSPFFKLSEAELIDVTVSNLKLIDEIRDRRTGTKFLNVLQAASSSGDLADSMRSEDLWFDAVKDFDFEGWAIGGDVGRRGGFCRFLRRMLILKNAGLLSPPRNWCHVLGIGTPMWSVFLTAIQRAVQNHASNPDFAISHDSATPYSIAGKNQEYALPAILGDELKNWTIRQARLEISYAVANEAAPIRFPASSPIAGALTLQDLLPRRGKIEQKRTDHLSDALLVNHNVYVYLTAMIRANEAVFTYAEAPQPLLDAIAIIDQLFATPTWAPLLDKHRNRLEATFKRALGQTNA